MFVNYKLDKSPFMKVQKKRNADLISFIGKMDHYLEILHSHADNKLNKCIHVLYVRYFII